MGFINGQLAGHPTLHCRMSAASDLISNSHGLMVSTYVVTSQSIQSMHLVTPSAAEPD